VLALGRPGRSVQATLGIVSALGDSWRTPAGGRLDRYLQTDVVMYPGFSCGPLVDATGQVLGLNTSALLRGISLIVPGPTLRRVIETLLAHRRMRRGYLGVGVQPVRLPAALIGFEDQPVAGIDDLHRLLTEKQVGMRSSLTIIRRVEMMGLDIVPEESKAR
jgi:S1-C subfamily serine protease